MSVDGDRAGLRVALVCPYSLSRPGGVQGQVVGLARALARLGHLPTVYAPVDPSGAADVDGLDLVATGTSTALPANGSVAPVSTSPRAAARALAELRRRRPDVVHVHEPLAPGLPWALLLARHLPPVVATFHRSGPSVPYRVAGVLARPATRRLAARCAVSEAARATAGSVVGGPVDVLFNGIDVERYRTAEPWPTTGPTVLFLGRHEERKGLRVLLDAVDRMAPGPGRAAPTVWVAGDGPETEALRRRHPGDGRVTWLGVVDEDEKVRRLAGADVLCAPSLGGESFGLVVLEGLAARAEVVASDIDGYRDAAGGCARLVPPGDAGALARALEASLDGAAGGDPDRTARLDAGARRADGWSMDRLAGAYVSRYREAVVGRGP